MKHKKIRVAINGFGRIGRAFLKLAFNEENIDIIAINDLGDVENMAYVLRYDSVYGRSEFDVQVHDKDEQTFLLLNGEKKIQIFSEEEPKNLPWKELEIDVVIESTGFFTEYKKASAHIKAGAKRVIISAPAKGDEDEVYKTVLLGVCDDISKIKIISNASCTTNSVSPILTIMDETIGIEKAVLNTIHAYTATQSVVDGYGKKDFRGGRAAGLNIIPSTTGAAIATTKVLTQLENKFDGIALRVPVPAGSISDITFISKQETTVEEVNTILKKTSLDDRWRGIFSTTTDPIVSQDIVGNTHASIADLTMTRVVGGNLIKILAWYDNEIGYTHTLIEQVIRLGQNLT